MSLNLKDGNTYWGMDMGEKIKLPKNIPNDF